jgi:CxxC motif-containing protein (DUF1111 family)
MGRPLAIVAVLGAALACTDAPTLAPPSITARSLTDSSLQGYNALLPIPPLPFEESLLGGLTTVFDATEEAFEQPSANLTPADIALHDAGNDGFEDVFDDVRGLGPHFNNPSCEGCHEANGRGSLPAPGHPLTTMLLRVSLPGVGANGGVIPVPGFGDQLQPNGVAPVPGEAVVKVTNTTTSGRYGDGTTFTLRKPIFTLTKPHLPLPAGVLVSPRVAPPNFGLGLLEAIPASTLSALSDEFDLDHDGISGKVNVAWDAINHSPAVGRFGLKSNTPSLRQQSAGAYNGDMGVTTSLFAPESCEGLYPSCAAHAAEVDDSILSVVTFYVQSLGVPARRNMNDLTVRLGQALFSSIGCARCHVPKLQTGTLAGVPSVSNQTIRPFTDLLVHDMGPGLADNRPDFLASGREWRTTPLWGVGLTQVVNPGSGYLHDGRARTLPEAILWHGGEALLARETFRLLPSTLRGALVRFLESL